MESSDSKPKKTKPSAYTVAIRQLSLREHTIKEIELYLRKKGYDEDMITVTVLKLREHSFINEERYISAAVRAWACKNKGPAFIQMKLKEKGIHICRNKIEAIYKSHAPASEEDLILKMLERKPPKIPKNPLEQKKLFRRYQAALLRKGFSPDAIHLCLKKIFQR